MRSIFVACNNGEMMFLEIFIGAKLSKIYVKLFIRNKLKIQTQIKWKLFFKN